MGYLFKRIGLAGRMHSPGIIDSLLLLAQALAEAGLSVVLENECLDGRATDFQQVARADLGKLVDLVLVIGGDGTMLTLAREMAPYRVPLAGVNQGRLGFMTDIPMKQMIPGVLALIAGEFEPEERILLEAYVQREDIHMRHELALNDVVFNRGAMGSMIEFEVFIDGQFVYSQRSDGLIVSTPTGSTAYALASGGPILHPKLPAIALVPICPQSMSNRPIVVPDTCVVEVTLTRGHDTRVHFDGHNHCELLEYDRIVIRRYPHSLRLLHPRHYNYYGMLRHKLRWGERLL